jgi:hypothetical protein
VDDLEAEPREEAVEKGPFGNPDASRTNISGSGLVDMTGVAPHLAIARTNFSSHMVVGRKGSGKTLHHRSLQDAAKQKGEFISIADSGILSEHTLKSIGLNIGQEAARSTWKLLWRRAIFSFLASMYYAEARQFHFEAAHKLHPFMDASIFKSKFSTIFARPVIELTPLQYIELISSKYRRLQELQSFLQDPAWVEFEAVIQASISSSPPVFLFFDALDTEDFNFPQLWYDCEYGLFMTLFDLLSIFKGGGRVHIVTTVRESVYRAVLRTPHATRYFGDSHLRKLSWGAKETRFFLEQKIAQLPGRLFQKKPVINSDKTLQNWLGFPTVRNNKREIVEPVSQYIIRHTRCLPRDIVIFGNLIFGQMERCSSLGIPFTDGYLRRCVEIGSRLFARESLKICASELLLTRQSINEYQRVLRMREEDIETVRPAMEAMIREFIARIGKEVFTPDELQKILLHIYGDDVPLFEGEGMKANRFDSLLWQHGLIAYWDDRGPGKGRWIYNWYSDSESEFLPTDATRYGFHPSLIDMIGIRNAGTEFVF